MEARGYSTRRFPVLQSHLFYQTPSPLQRASFSDKLVKLVDDRNIPELFSMLTCGISPNPCKPSGRSLLHIVCRKGDHEMLRHCFLEVHSDIIEEEDCEDDEDDVHHQYLDPTTLIRCADKKGRTVLHEACTASTSGFEVVKLLAKLDVTLFNMVDDSGATPLSFVPNGDWAKWVEFLEAVKDIYWPLSRCKDGTCVTESFSFSFEVLNVAFAKSNDVRSLPDPPKPLDVGMAQLVAMGKLTPQNANAVRSNDKDDESSQGDSFCLEDCADDLGSQADNGGDSVSLLGMNSVCTRGTMATFDEKEMAAILDNAKSGKNAPVPWSKK